MTKHKLVYLLSTLSALFTFLKLLFNMTFWWVYRLIDLKRSRLMSLNTPYQKMASIIIIYTYCLARITVVCTNNDNIYMCTIGVYRIATGTNFMRDYSLTKELRCPLIGSDYDTGRARNEWRKKKYPIDR